MRSIAISVDEHYHLCNRGAHKSLVFHDKRDYMRFLFLILFLQSPVNFANISRHVEQFVQHSVFNIDKTVLTELCKTRYIELVAFCLMPNHFHLVVKEVEEHGIPRYMQRVLNAYTKYYNTKYETSGHLFQGPYRAVHVEHNDQLLYLSTYIHRNPRELRAWKGTYAMYPYSSYQDFVDHNRWKKILMPDIILEQFNNKTAYAKFTRESSAKMRVEELGDIFLEI